MKENFILFPNVYSYYYILLIKIYNVVIVVRGVDNVGNGAILLPGSSIRRQDGCGNPLAWIVDKWNIRDCFGNHTQGIQFCPRAAPMFSTCLFTENLEFC
jgi:hypothetical protein